MIWLFLLSSKSLILSPTGIKSWIIILLSLYFSWYRFIFFHILYLLSLMQEIVVINFICENFRNFNIWLMAIEFLKYIIGSLNFLWGRKRINFVHIFLSFIIETVWCNGPTIIAVFLNNINHHHLVDHVQFEK